MHGCTTVDVDWHSPFCSPNLVPVTVEPCEPRTVAAYGRPQEGSPQNLQNRTLLCFPAGVVKTTRREKLTTVAQIVYKIKRNETKIIQITRLRTGRPDTHSASAIVKVWVHANTQQALDGFKFWSRTTAASKAADGEIAEHLIHWMLEFYNPIWLTFINSWRCNKITSLV